MENTYWLRQNNGPLFSDLLWSRPENKRSAGKLLIVGGNSHSFAAVSQAYAQALKAGIGSARVLLPDKLAKNLSKLMPEALFAPSTPSGGFASNALAELIDASGWADAVLLAGDFGRNSETAILLEKFADKFTGPLVISGDSVDYFVGKQIAARPNTIVAGSLAQLQKMAAESGNLIRQADELLALVESLHEWTEQTEAGLITIKSGQVVAAYKGRVSTTPAGRVEPALAGFVAVWQAQQPAKPFEALSSAVYACLHEQ